MKKLPYSGTLSLKRLTADQIIERFREAEEELDDAEARASYASQVLERMEKHWLSDHRCLCGLSGITPCAH